MLDEREDGDVPDRTPEEADQGVENPGVLALILRRLLGLGGHPDLNAWGAYKANLWNVQREKVRGSTGS